MFRSHQTGRLPADCFHYNWGLLLHNLGGYAARLVKPGVCLRQMLSPLLNERDSKPASDLSTLGDRMQSLSLSMKNSSTALERTSFQTNYWPHCRLSAAKWSVASIRKVFKIIKVLIILNLKIILKIYLNASLMSTLEQIGRN